MPALAKSQISEAYFDDEISLATEPKEFWFFIIPKRLGVELLANCILMIKHILIRNRLLMHLPPILNLLAG